MLEIREIIRASSQGVTVPVLCKGDDGALYWCKGDQAGLASCRNEWVCGCLAKALNLSIPKFDIAKVPWELFVAWRNLAVDVPPLIKESNPYVFASRHVEDAKDIVSVREIKDVDESDQVKIFLFDEFIRNVDRTDSNSNLLVTAAKQWYVIDHNLSYAENFDRPSFVSDHLFKNSIHGEAYRVKDAFLARIKEVFTVDFLESVWSEMPNSWVSDDAAEAHKERILKTIQGE